jgi:hypothetical protein
MAHTSKVALEMIRVGQSVKDAMIVACAPTVQIACPPANAEMKKTAASQRTRRT